MGEGDYKFEIKKVSSTEFDTPVFFTDQDKKYAPEGFLGVYREMGWKNYFRAEYEAATRNFNIALGMFADDRRTIIGRGFSRAKNTLFEGALKDAEKCLNVNEYDKEAIYLQASAKYELGDFEDGLMAFRNGMNKRGKRRPMFVNGRYQAEGTIEDCVGRFAGPCLTNMRLDIKKMEMKRKRDEWRKAHEEKCVDNLDIPPPHPCSDVEWNRYVRAQKQLNNVLSEKYLGKMNVDRKWLEDTLENPSMTSANKKGSAKLYILGRTALNDLNNRQEMLRSRKPFYHLEFLVEEAKDRMAATRARSDLARGRVLKESAEAMLKEMKKRRALRDTKRCMELADRIKITLDQASRRLVPTKKQLLHDLFETIGSAYLDLKKYKIFLTKIENKKRGNYLLGFDVAYRDLKQEPLIQESSFPYFDYKNWMKKYEDYLLYTEDPEERAWLYHEIGRCYGELQKYEHMVLRGKKCFRAAKEANSMIWILNGLCMVCIGSMNFHDKDEAVASLKDCLGYAYQHGDEDIIEFLLMIGKILSEKDVQEAFEDANTIIRKREEFILSLIHDAEIRERAKNLFARIRVMETKRRMSVVPGMVPMNNKFTNRTCWSILPGGSGGRLGLHPVGEMGMDAFIDLTQADLAA